MLTKRCSELKKLVEQKLARPWRHDCVTASTATRLQEFSPTSLAVMLGNKPHLSITRNQMNTFLWVLHTGCSHCVNLRVIHFDKYQFSSSHTHFFVHIPTFVQTQNVFYTCFDKRGPRLCLCRPIDLTLWMGTLPCAFPVATKLEFCSIVHILEEPANVYTL